MPCNHPFKAFKTGYLTEKGKDDLAIAFDDCESDLLLLERVRKPVKLSAAPHVMLDGKIYLSDPIYVPCGKCVGCRIERAREWKVRNCLELAFNPEAYFVTLTYDDRHLPFTRLGEPCLCKNDVQRFFKRLRRSGYSFRYFGCGEYGDVTARPHYHLILYGHFDDFRLLGPNKFESLAIQDAWGFGQTVVETVSPGSIAYVCGYVEKKFKSDLDGYPVKPFLMMSRKPGIGMAYLAKHVDSLESDMHVYGRFSENVTSSHAPVPKSFRRKLQDLPWYEEWKKAAMLAGESMDETMKVVYSCADYARRHDAIDQALYNRLEKVRNECL